MIFQSIQHLTIRLLKIFGKPLFNLLNNKKNITFRSRKTLPCTKGIKTRQRANTDRGTSLKNFFYEWTDSLLSVGCFCWCCYINIDINF